MTPVAGVIFCLAYIVGLLASGVSLGGDAEPSVRQILLNSLGVFGLGIIFSLIMPRVWRFGPRAKLWLAASLVAVVATIYCGCRIPSPADDDISHFIPNVDVPDPIRVVQGWVEEEPRLTPDQRSRFWLNVASLRTQIDLKTGMSERRSLSGKLYVKAPLLQTTGLYRGQLVEVTGQLYQPQAAQNPNGFDFKAYLNQRGAFAGLTAKQVDIPTNQTRPQWRLWRLRQRIVQTQARWLGSPAGPLVSAMTLGRRAVDLPDDIRAAFIRAGLAHTLAASGFHVSLVLGLVLALTRSLEPQLQFGIGSAALLLYVCITGGAVSVLRAAIMGFGALIGLATERKIKPLGCLLLAATLLLLWNPQWIWDIGFQLSVMATLGLVVMVQPLVKRLDWMPSAIASLVAVPIAAYVWTLPLQLFYFNTFSPYTILLNILATPLVILISLGGLVSAVAASIWTDGGGAIAWLLNYPIQALIALVEFCNSQPASSIAVRQIALHQLLLLYSLYGFGWLHPWWRRRRWLVGLLTLILIILPGWYRTATLTQATVLAAANDPVLVLQDHRQTSVINEGDGKTAFYTLLPFLKQAGINRLDWGVAPALSTPALEGWRTILAQAPMSVFLSPQETDPIPEYPKQYQPLSSAQAIAMGDLTLHTLAPDFPVLWFKLREQTWLLLHRVNPAMQREMTATGQLPQSNVLWWSGEALTEELLEAVRPRAAIASAITLDKATERRLRDRGVQLYWTGRDGAIQWTPESGFRSILNSTLNDL